MAELKFVLKGFLFSVLVALGLQLKIGGETLESKSDRWIHSSGVGIFLNQAASGAVSFGTKSLSWVNQYSRTLFGKTEARVPASQSKSWRIETHHKVLESADHNSEAKSVADEAQADQ